MSRSDWIADRLDAAYVHGWVVTGSGDDLPEALLTYGFESSFPALERAGACRCASNWEGWAWETSPPGEYRLYAVVVALDLWSAPGRLHLT